MVVFSTTATTEKICKPILHYPQVYSSLASSNDVLELQIDAAGTQYASNTTSQAAFEILIDGDQWMIYRNVKTNVLHWDFVSLLSSCPLHQLNSGQSTLPRFISFPVIDAQ
jgi:hypothetical protein